MELKEILFATYWIGKSWWAHYVIRKDHYLGTCGGPVVKTLPSKADSDGSILGLGVNIPHALWLKKNKT